MSEACVYKAPIMKTGPLLVVLEYSKEHKKAKSLNLLSSTDVLYQVPGSIVGKINEARGLEHVTENGGVVGHAIFA